MSHDWCRLALPTGRLRVRAPRPGDRIDIGTGSKKVADALNEAGIAVRKRSAWPACRVPWQNRLGGRRPGRRMGPGRDVIEHMD